MRKGISKLLFAYVLFDYISALLVWALFYLFRKSYLENFPFEFSSELFFNRNFINGILAVPVFWFLLYILFDSYRDIYRMSRLTELIRTIITVFTGTLVIFFLLILNDIVYYAEGYKSYYISFFALFFTHLIITLFFRFVFLEISKYQLRKGIIKFNSILIGSSELASKLYSDIIRSKSGYFYNFIGFVTVYDQPKTRFENDLSKFPHLGKIDYLENILDDKNIDEVILALEPSESLLTQQVLNKLSGRNIIIKVIPDMYEILLGKVKMSNVFGEALIEISPQLMPLWFSIAKRLADILISSLVIIIFSPLYLYVAIRVKLSSKGPILYKQARIGWHGKPFMIFKFRSMYLDSEKNGPMLSNDHDDRCTPWGKTIRKYRLDEIPQFWNVLIGDMSLVGPRPERKFFIDQIAEKAPHVRQLQKVRPGITSWGQVKYGYASNVDEMIQRLKYDILYIENISLALDLKIIFYTIVVILQGRGK